jgi:hypothetical protein
MQNNCTYMLLQDTKKCSALRGTVQFLYIETSGVRKWRKTKGEEEAWFEDSSYFMVGDISEQYQPQIHRLLQH